MSYYKLIFLLLVVAVPVLFISGISSSRQKSEPVRIGVASMITPVDAVKYYQEIIDYISAKLNMPVEMIHRRTYDEMDKLLEKGSVDAAFICSAPYVRNRRNFGAELLVAPLVNGTPLYNSYIIVHKDSDINSFDGLKGKIFAFVDPKSNTGKLYPEYFLAKEGHTVKDFFKRYLYSYSHNKSVELVAKKIVDGAAVESLVYHYMEQKNSPYIRETRIILKSPDFGIPPVVVSKDTPTFMKEKIKEILLDMHRDPKGQAILKAMLIDRFIEVPDSNYDSIREMEKFVSSSAPSEVKGKKDESVVYFAVIPRDNPRIAYEKYQPLIDYLSENLKYDFELVLKKTYEDTVNALGNGDVDMALLGPLTYLEAHARYGAVAVLKSVTNKGESSYRSVIVTGGNQRVNRISQLKGKSFAFASAKSTSGNLIPRLIMAKEGVHLDELMKYRNFNYHDSVVKWVLKGEYDAGSVRETVAEKYLPLGLRIIATSEAITTGPVVIGPQTAFVIAEKVKETLLNMNRTNKGREILKKLDPELRGGFVEAYDSDYKNIREKINSVPETCGIGCHPKIKL